MKTAVEWLENILLHKVQLTEMEKMYIQQAKEMEKEQIINAWCGGYDEEDRASRSGFHYYKETFK